MGVAVLPYKSTMKQRPALPKEVAKGTLRAIIRYSGLTVEDFTKLL